MDRRPFMCLPMLIHLLPFGPVADAACCRAGGHYQGGPGERYRGGPGGFYRGGPGGFYRGGPGGFYRGGLLLMIVLSLALRPFCESYGNGHSV